MIFDFSFPIVSLAVEADRHMCRYILFTKRIPIVSHCPLYESEQVMFLRV